MRPTPHWITTPTKANLLEACSSTSKSFTCGIPKQPDSQWVYYVAPSKDKFTFQCHALYRQAPPKAFFYEQWDTSPECRTFLWLSKIIEMSNTTTLDPSLVHMTHHYSPTNRESLFNHNYQI
jgi:hypothetical protein